MSANLFPIPNETQVFDKARPGFFAMVWQRFFKSISDDMLQANIAKNSMASKDFKYVLNVIHCDCNWLPSTPLVAPLVVDLPYTALLGFEVAGVFYPPGTTRISIPVGTTFSQFFYIAQPAKT